MDCSQDSITHGPKHNNHMDSNLEISETIVCKLSAVLNTCLGSFIKQFVFWAVALSCVK